MKNQLITHKIADFFKLRMGDVKFDPPYQRKEVWEKSRQQELIRSIVDGIPIGSPILNEEGPDDAKIYVCIDGKQRLSSIKNFKEDKLKVSFPSFDKFFDKEKSVNYSQLVKYGQGNDDKAKEAKEILNRFRNFEISCLECIDLSLIEQAKLFEKVNYNLSLSKEEELFGKYYNAKMIVEYLESNLRPALSLSSSKNDKRNLRGRMTGEVLKFFYCLFPANNIDQIEPRLHRVTTCDLKGFNKICSIVHDEVIKYLDKNKDVEFYSNSKEEIEKFLKSSKLFVKLNLYTRLTNLFVEKKIIEEVTIAKKSTSWWVITYFSIFLLEKVDNEIITEASINNNLYQFQELFKEYKSWLLEGYDDNHENFFGKVRQMTNNSTYKNHQDKLDELFDKHIKDVGIKNKGLPTDLKKLGLEFYRDNGCICYMCKKPLDEKHAHDDHFNPKSISSDPSYSVVLCEICNLKKTNNDNKSANNLVSYFNSYPKDFESWYEKKYGKKYRKSA